jgi:hypothetical protein
MATKLLDSQAQAVRAGHLYMTFLDNPLNRLNFLLFLQQKNKETNYRIALALNGKERNQFDVNLADAYTDENTDRNLLTALLVMKYHTPKQPHLQTSFEYLLTSGISNQQAKNYITQLSQIPEYDYFVGRNGPVPNSFKLLESLKKSAKGNGKVIFTYLVEHLQRSKNSDDFESANELLLTTPNSSNEIRQYIQRIRSRNILTALLLQDSDIHKSIGKRIKALKKNKDDLSKHQLVELLSVKDIAFAFPEETVAWSSWNHSFGTNPEEYDFEIENNNAAADAQTATVVAPPPLLPPPPLLSTAKPPPGLKPEENPTGPTPTPGFTPEENTKKLPPGPISQSYDPSTFVPPPEIVTAKPQRPLQTKNENDTDDDEDDVKEEDQEAVGMSDSDRQYQSLRDHYKTTQSFFKSNLGSQKVATAVVPGSNVYQAVESTNDLNGSQAAETTNDLNGSQAAETTNDLNGSQAAETTNDSNGSQAAETTNDSNGSQTLVQSNAEHNVDSINKKQNNEPVESPNDNPRGTHLGASVSFQTKSPRPTFVQSFLKSYDNYLPSKKVLTPTALTLLNLINATPNYELKDELIKFFGQGEGSRWKGYLQSVSIPLFLQLGLIQSAPNTNTKDRLYKITILQQMISNSFSSSSTTQNGGQKKTRNGRTVRKHKKTKFKKQRIKTKTKVHQNRKYIVSRKRKIR